MRHVPLPAWMIIITGPAENHRNDRRGSEPEGPGGLVEMRIGGRAGMYGRAGSDPARPASSVSAIASDGPVDMGRAVPDVRPLRIWISYTNLLIRSGSREGEARPSLPPGLGPRPGGVRGDLPLPRGILGEDAHSGSSRDHDPVPWVLEPPWCPHALVHRESRVRRLGPPPRGDAAGIGPAIAAAIDQRGPPSGPPGAATAGLGWPRPSRVSLRRGDR